MPSKSALYDKDFYAWSREQAALLRAGQLGEADVEHIAEEIESMGKTEKRELVSRLTVLLMHLQLHLADNPSLKAIQDAAVGDAYRLAVIGARRETGLSAETFPQSCPWTFAQAVVADFWPD